MTHAKCKLKRKRLQSTSFESTQWMIKNTKVTINKKEKGPMERNEKINSRISKNKIIGDISEIFEDCSLWQKGRFIGSIHPAVWLLGKLCFSIFT